MERKNSFALSVRELAVFSMLGALMFISKLALEFLPNIHLLGMFSLLFSVVYRKKGLIPIYVFVLLEGLYSGFALWWLPYLYLWTILWAVGMLLPRDILTGKFTLIYPLVCGFHGLFYGVLYAPLQALLFGLNFRQTIAWIAAGLPWDAVHACGNFAAGFLVLPLAKFILKIERKSS